MKWYSNYFQFCWFFAFWMGFFFFFGLKVVVYGFMVKVAIIYTIWQPDYIFTLSFSFTFLVFFLFVNYTIEAKTYSFLWVLMLSTHLHWKNFWKLEVFRSNQMEILCQLLWRLHFSAANESESWLSTDQINMVYMRFGLWFKSR